MTLYRIVMMASLLLWRVIWEIVGQLNLVLLFPPLSEVIASMGEIFSSSRFQRATVITLQSFIWGMLIAIVAGVALGLLMGRVKAADKLLGMWVNVFVSAPLSALVPIIMILFGFALVISEGVRTALLPHWRQKLTPPARSACSIAYQNRAEMGPLVVFGRLTLRLNPSYNRVN